MRKNVIIGVLCFFASCSFVTDKREALPSFDVLMLDSTTIFKTDSIPEGKPFVMLYFSPDCEHCQEQVKDLLDNMASFNNIQFYFFTPFSFELLKLFCKHYHLNNYPNITVGWDSKFFIPNHFKTKSVPYVFVYNREKRLTSVYEGGLKATELKEALSKTN